MPHIVVFIHEFISALQHLKHYCHYWNAAERSILSVHPIIATHMSIIGYGKKAYILKYLLDFKNNLINIGCASLYHLSMTYITVYNLSINSNYRILAAELNYRFSRFWKRDIGTSPYRSFNFQQLFFYDIFCATRILRVIGRQSIVYNHS